MENIKSGLYKTMLNESMSHSESQDHDVDNNNLDREVKLEGIISTNDVSMLGSNATTKLYQNENNGMLHHPPQVEPSPSKTLIFDTKDLF